MLIIGITGQFCSGKSTIAKILSEAHNAVIIDADKIGHSVLLNKNTAKRLVDNFGSGIIKKGVINRKILAERVFANAKNHKILCEITHALLADKIKNKLSGIKLKNPQATVIIDAAVLIELGIDRFVDKLIAVKISRKEQFKRARRKWRVSDKDIEKRIKLQFSFNRLALKADFIIDNSGSLENTKKQVEKFLSLVPRYRTK